MLADVAYGSLADMDGADFDVRYTECPLCAMNAAIR